jgi:hypothetical protein
MELVNADIIELHTEADTRNDEMREQELLGPMRRLSMRGEWQFLSERDIYNIKNVHRVLLV